MIPVLLPKNSSSFNWYERLLRALERADKKLQVVNSKKYDSSILPSKKNFHAVFDNPSLGKAFYVNESVKAHIKSRLGNSWILGIYLLKGASLETCFRLQVEFLSHCMWVFSGLLGFLKRDGYTPLDLGLFNQLVTSLSVSLVPILDNAVAGTNFICHKRRLFYVSHLPAHFDTNKGLLLRQDASLVGSLFDEAVVEKVLSLTKDYSSLQSQQAMVQVALRGNSPSSSSLRYRSPNRRSPSKRFRSRTPPRTPKRVRFSKYPPPPKSSLSSLGK